MQDTFFRSQIQRHGATRVSFGINLTRAPKPRDVEGPIWFETQNFGWILSAKDANGNRRVLLQY